MVSKVPLVGLNPTSSASVPKVSEPPGLGVAVETPLGGWPEDEGELEPELQRGQHAARGPDDGDAGTGCYSPGQKRTTVDPIRHIPPWDWDRDDLGRRPRRTALMSLVTWEKRWKRYGDALTLALRPSAWGKLR